VLKNCTGPKNLFWYNRNRVGAERTSDISGLLQAWSGGDKQALEHLVAAVYPEIRRIARQRLRAGPDQSLESAALANEAYLRLIAAPGIRCNNRAHFFALCAQVIRRIVIDHARRHRFAKHGGNAVRVPFEEAFLGARARGVDLVALDDALAALAEIDPRKAQVVELRYFGGLTAQEAAEVLHVSPDTVLRDWKMARSWLFRELTKR
jgi:RNA polymerase sigma factor (TIGR02999 family)